MYSQAAITIRILHPKVRPMAMSVYLSFVDASGASSPIRSNAIYATPRSTGKKRKQRGKQVVPKEAEPIHGNV
ncbi:hypothetical protein ABIB94_008908 [Bradyrhizobium sp. JR7.2]